MSQMVGVILLWVGAFIEIMIVPVAIRGTHSIECMLAAGAVLICMSVVYLKMEKY